MYIRDYIYTSMQYSPSQKTDAKDDKYIVCVNNCTKRLLGSDTMKIRIRSLCSISAFLVVAGLPILTGCSNKKTQALFTKPDLITRSRFAVIGLTPEQEQIFMAHYIKAFPAQVITFVERTRLQEIISEQDLLQGRLDENTRAKLKRLFGVEALIMCTYYDGSDGLGIKKFRVRIVDSATGAIIGSVITEANDNFTYHSDTAVKALKTDLLGGS